MKKTLYIIALAFGLMSCENFFLEHQLGYEPSITVTRNFAYTLTDADYASIANNKTNRNIAILMDEDDSTYYFALQKLATQKYFTEKIAPDQYIPAFFAQKYPQLSEGSMCEITYSIQADQPFYFADFKAVKDTVFANPPADDTAIRTALDAGFPAAPEGTVVVVYPDDNSAWVYVRQSDGWNLYTSNFVKQVLAVEKSLYTTLEAEYLVAPDDVLPIWLTRRFPYATADDTYGILYKSAVGVYAIAEYVYNGQVWDKTENIVHESMSFEMKDAWKANISTYLSEPFIGHGQGAFVVQNVLLADPLTYVWYYSASYGMCASAYKDGASHDSEAWLISPMVKLKKAKTPKLIFDQAFNKAANFTEEATVLVSTDYKGDVTTATWTALEWAKNDDGTLNVPAGSSWVFQSSGDLDMTPFAGQSVYIAFRYTTSGGVSGTWEIKNVLLYEPETAE